MEGVTLRDPRSDETLGLMDPVMDTDCDALNENESLLTLDCVTSVGDDDFERDTDFVGVSDTVIETSADADFVRDEEPIVKSSVGDAVTDVDGVTLKVGDSLTVGTSVIETEGDEETTGVSESEGDALSVLDGVLM